MCSRSRTGDGTCSTRSNLRPRTDRASEPRGDQSRPGPPAAASRWGHAAQRQGARAFDGTGMCSRTCDRPGGPGPRPLDPERPRSLSAPLWPMPPQSAASTRKSRPSTVPRGRAGSWPRGLSLRLSTKDHAVPRPLLDAGASCAGSAGPCPAHPLPERTREPLRSLETCSTGRTWTTPQHSVELWHREQAHSSLALHRHPIQPEGAREPVGLSEPLATLPSEEPA